jgi:hypothetical protein
MPPRRSIPRRILHPAPQGRPAECYEPALLAPIPSTSRNNNTHIIHYDSHDSPIRHIRIPCREESPRAFPPLAQLNSLGYIPSRAFRLRYDQRAADSRPYFPERLERTLHPHVAIFQFAAAIRSTIVFNSRRPRSPSCSSQPNVGGCALHRGVHRLYSCSPVTKGHRRQRAPFQFFLRPKGIRRPMQVLAMKPSDGNCLRCIRSYVYFELARDLVLKTQKCFQSDPLLATCPTCDSDILVNICLGT